MTNYQYAKNQLKLSANYARGKYPKDKPAQCEIINNSCDHLIREFNLSSHHADLLSLYASKLQP